jgi:LacI family transcriptional regulator
MHHPESDDVDRIINRLLSHQVDGILWAVPEIGNNRAWLEKRGAYLPIPVIYLSMQPMEHLLVASIDNYLGGCLAAEHLLAQGYRHIGIITGPLDWWETRQRLAGWRKALETAGLSAEETQIVPGDWSAASGAVGIQKLWLQFPELDAVFACNDQMALGAMQAAYRLGKRLPQDLALVGFDNIPESQFFWPALTTVNQPLVELGERAVEALVQLISAEQSDERLESAESVLLTPALIVRDSTSVHLS